MRRIWYRAVILGCVLTIAAVIAFSQAAHSPQRMTTGFVFVVLAAAAFYLSWAIPRWRLNRIARQSLKRPDSDAE